MSYFIAVRRPNGRHVVAFQAAHRKNPTDRDAPRFATPRKVVIHLRMRSALDLARFAHRARSESKRDASRAEFVDLRAGRAGGVAAFPSSRGAAMSRQGADEDSGKELLETRARGSVEPRGRHGERVSFGLAFALTAFIALPTVALAMHLWRANAPFVPEHVVEQYVQLSESGPVVVDLHSSLERPDEVFSDVIFRVSSDLRIDGFPGLQDATSSPRCDSRECVLVLHHVGHVPSEMRLKVPKAGIYEIRMERSRGLRRKMDMLVLHAVR